MTAEELRVRADQLREVLHVLHNGEVEASARERAFVAGALHAVELMQEDLRSVLADSGEQASTRP